MAPASKNGSGGSGRLPKLNSTTLSHVRAALSYGQVNNARHVIGCHETNERGLANSM